MVYHVMVIAELYNMFMFWTMLMFVSHGMPSGEKSSEVMICWPSVWIGKMQFVIVGIKTEFNTCPAINHK